MTKMWPSVYDPIKMQEAPGEKIVFDRLRNNIECEEWYVFHSFFIEDHQSQQEGEIDFVVFIPNKGIVSVEVKSHLSIEYKNRQWVMGKTTETRGPLEQANGNKWSLVKAVEKSEKEPPDWKKIPKTHVAIFPRAKFKYDGLEFENWRICDSDQSSKSISQFLLYAINQEIKDNKENYENKKVGPLWKPGIFDNKYMKKVVSILSPEISSEIESVEDRETRINKEIEDLTPRQKEALYAAEGNRKLLIDGLAGTGKTIIATELAGKAHNNGEKVCYICYNKGLANFIGRKYKNIGFDVFNIDKLLLKLSTFSSPPKDADDMWWDFTLVENAYDNLLALQEEYDYLIIDECQDLASGLNYMFLDRLLKGGFTSGKWTMLGDLENQNLYNSQSDLDRFLTDNLGDSFLRYPLKINCRNTPSTVEIVKDLTKVTYFETLRQEGLQAPRTYVFEDESDQVKKVDFLLENLLETYKLNEIIFLTPPNSKFIDFYNENSKYKITEYNFELLKQKSIGPFHTTIKKFKGLEYNIVILLDIKQEHFSTQKALVNEVYTGLTRSLETTCIFFNSETKEYLLGSS